MEGKRRWIYVQIDVICNRQIQPQCTSLQRNQHDFRIGAGECWRLVTAGGSLGYRFALTLRSFLLALARKFIVFIVDKIVVIDFVIHDEVIVLAVLYDLYFIIAVHDGSSRQSFAGPLWPRRPCLRGGWRLVNGIGCSLVLQGYLELGNGLLPPLRRHFAIKADIWDPAGAIDKHAVRQTLSTHAPLLLERLSNLHRI